MSIELNAKGYAEASLVAMDYLIPANQLRAIIEAYESAKALEQPCHDEGCPHYGKAIKCEPKEDGCIATVPRQPVDIAQFEKEYFMEWIEELSPGALRRGRNSPKRESVCLQDSEDKKSCSSNLAENEEQNIGELAIQNGLMDSPTAFAHRNRIEQALRTISDEGKSDAGIGFGAFDFWIKLQGIEYYFNVKPTKSSKDQSRRG